MPLFRFQVVHTGGKKTTGVMEADSLVAAKERLRLQQMIIIELAPYLETKKKLSMSFAHLLDMTRMLSRLLNAGIPLYEALIMTEEKYIKFSFHPLLVDLCDRVKKGESLSIALSHYPHIFDPIYVAMIKAGEASGAFASSFQQLISLLENKDRLKKQLVSATTYHLFIGAFCIVIFVSLLIWVIPSLKNLFEGRALHPLTRFVFELSDLFLNHSMLIALSFGGMVLLIYAGLSLSRLRPYWDQLMLKIPFIGPLILLAATVRFCRTCSLLLEGGTPLLRSLELARAILKNDTLQQAAFEGEKKVSEGEPLSLQTTWMPPLVSRMLAIGEKTGQIAPMLHHIASLSEEQLSRTLQRYTSLLQPILLLFLGLLIGTVILSILIPLTDVGSMLQ